jgi:hypothetical protein
LEDIRPSCLDGFERNHSTTASEIVATGKRQVVYGAVMAVDIDHASRYVESVDLEGIPRGIVAQDAASDAGATIFDAAKQQAQVVGSGLFSFAEGVTTEMRDAISTSALLAQLLADKQFSKDEQPTDWFAAYEKVLRNVGWVLQDHSWSDYTAQGTSVEVHEKIIEVLTAALGPSAAALDIIRSAIDVLKNMAPASSWLTIFNREAEQANIARFQVGLADKDEDGDVYVILLACLIQAKSTLTQVLVLKFRDEHASFKASSAKVSISWDVLKDVTPKIKKKVLAYANDYVSSIQDL